MELANLNITVLLLIVSLNFVKLEECDVQTSSKGIYEHFDDIRTQSRMRARNMLLNSCRYGAIIEISDEQLCFDHCTLRDNCIAVNTTFEGCQMCYLDELLDDITPFDSGFSNIYIRQNVSSKHLIFMKSKNNRILL